MSTPRLRQQRGTALVIAMLFLVILGMLGITTMTATTLEERMAGNVRDRDIAMQAAEAVLRDAERDLTNTNAAFRVVKANSFLASCAGGLCLQPGGPLPTPFTDVPLGNLTDVTKSAFYGQFTGEIPIQGPVQQPRYMIELLGVEPAQLPAPPVGSTVKNFRVTARGVGKNPNTVVLLQTVFQMTIPNT